MEELIRMLDEDLDYAGHKIIDGKMEITVLSNREESVCPFCGAMSGKSHSTYERSVQDLPIQGMQVVLIIRNRKMFCRNPECPHKTFAERFEFIGDKSKKTKRLETEIFRVSLNLSSVAAAELLSRNTASVGKSTICRLLKKGLASQRSIESK